MADPRVLGIVLAGGAGTRLAPLTDDRAKPAVPFGGVYRLVDFALSNLANSGIRKICVLTQYKSHSLDRHISTTWRMSDLLGNYVTPVPAQQRLGPHWYTGSGDAIFQSMNLINDEHPDLVVVFGADHVYRMDPRQMIAQHLEYGAGATVAAIPVSRQDAKDFGVLAVAKDGRTIERFLEKPANPPPMPGSTDESYASMGIYVFGRKELVDALERDAADPESRHDIGGNIIPMMVADGSAQAYDFLTNSVPGSTERDAGYWRDVGTIDAYFDAHMDLRTVEPMFNLYNDEWPILTHMDPLPPAKFVHDSGDRVGRAIDSLVSNGVIVSGGLVRGSVLSPGVRVNSWSTVDRAVLLHNVNVGRHVEIRDAIIDKNVDRARGGEDRGGQGARPRPRLLGLPRRHHRGRQGSGRARVKVSLLTREYPPDVYGGAGVHVEYLARALSASGLVDLTVHCEGADRPGAVAHRPWDALSDSVLRVFSEDLSMAEASADAAVVHSHTWYANLAGHLASLRYGIPHVVTVHSLEPLRPWKAEQLGGGYALSSWAERVSRSVGGGGGGGLRRDARRRADRVPGDRGRPGPGDQERDRHRRVRARSGHVGAGQARHRPVPAVRHLRRAVSPGRRACRCCCGRRPRSTRPPSWCSARARPTRPRSPRRCPRWSPGCRRPARGSSGSRRCCPSRRSSSCSRTR